MPAFTGQSPGAAGNLPARLLLSVCMAIMLCLPVPCTADGPVENEYRVKAAFLYNFARFTSWPESDNTQFNLCILGENPFHEELETLSGKSVHDHPLVISYTASVQDSAHCNAVFISRSSADSSREIITSLGDRPVLTVSDIENFTAQGGMIGLHTIDSRVRFSVNIESAAKSGLSISSKLLSLATSIRTGNR